MKYLPGSILNLSIFIWIYRSFEKEIIREVYYCFVAWLIPAYLFLKCSKNSKVKHSTQEFISTNLSLDLFSLTRNLSNQNQNPLFLWEGQKTVFQHGTPVVIYKCIKYWTKSYTSEKQTDKEHILKQLPFILTCRAFIKVDILHSSLFLSLPCFSKAST